MSGMARPFQFRLRSLFLITTVAALLSFVGTSGLVKWCRLVRITFILEN
jgi:hypothetical protein